jgi:hypothetical protein
MKKYTLTEDAKQTNTSLKSLVFLILIKAGCTDVEIKKAFQLLKTITLVNGICD